MESRAYNKVEAAEFEWVEAKMRNKESKQKSFRPEINELVLSREREIVLLFVSTVLRCFARVRRASPKIKCNWYNTPATSARNANLAALSCTDSTTELLPEEPLIYSHQNITYYPIRWMRVL